MTTRTINAWAAETAGGNFEQTRIDLPTLPADEVDIDVLYCGICHSDLSMLDNEWGQTAYPFVGGHEVVGRVAAVGSNVKHLQPGAVVGVGWHADSCMHCNQCVAGDHNLCADATGTIAGRPGGFADKIRVNATWAFALPDGLAPEHTGPLFCGGITVFNPFVQLSIKPTDRVGVIGIGGLGHLALQFARAWGCHVTAFSTSEDKEAEAKSLGAHDFVAPADAAALKPLAGQFDAIISTVNVPLTWDLYVRALAPKGKLHTVGAVIEPFGVSNGFMLIGGQKSISGSPVGAPSVIRDMLQFAARHNIQAQTEQYALSDINNAMDRLRNGSPRYRIVLDCQR